MTLFKMFVLNMFELPYRKNERNNHVYYLALLGANSDRQLDSV